MTTSAPATGRLAAITLAALLFTSPALLAKTKMSPKEKDIRRLMELTGAAELGLQVMNQLLPNLKRLAPQLPEAFWNGLSAEVNVDELIDLIVPIYDRYLTHDEIKQVITFFETPVGRKLISVQPKITEESTLAGQQWGMELARRLVAKIEAQKQAPEEKTTPKQ